MKEIILTQNKIAFVDDEDFELLNRFAWQAIKQGKLWYARTTLSFPDGTKMLCTLQSAVLKIKTPKGILIDHKNGNGLDCQKENLRVVYCRQNTQNKHRTYTSKYPGVSLQKSTGKWIAHIKIGSIVKHLGSFKTEEEAFAVYKHAVSICGQTVLYDKEEVTGD